jgi:BASS family bile acid:Na+ symporter
MNLVLVLLETNVLRDVLLPLALGIIMFGMGLTLTLADFRRVVASPKAALVGLGLQMLLLPALGYAVAVGFGLQPIWAVGLMLLAICPGGATSNFITHLVRGDVALSISLTAVNSLLILATVPALLSFFIAHFMGQEQAIVLKPAELLVALVAITLVPVSLGMLLKAKAPALTQKLLKPLNILSIVFFFAIVAGAVASQRSLIFDNLSALALPALALNLSGMFVAYWVARLLGLGLAQQRAVCVEVGIQNGTLAITIAITLLNNTPLAVPAAIYSLLMFATALGFGVFTRIAARKRD